MPSKKRPLRGPSLLVLSDEVLAQILNSLPLKPAFYLAITNKRLLTIFRTSFETIDVTTPFITNTIYTEKHLTSILHQTHNLKTLKLSTPHHLPHHLPLHHLSCVDAINQPWLTIPTLRELCIDSPLDNTPKLLSSVLPNLSKLSITNIQTHTLLNEMATLLKRDDHSLKHLTITIVEQSISSITYFIRVINSLQTLTNLNTFEAGIKSPQAVSRSRDEINNDFIKTLVSIVKILANRPVPDNRNTKVHLFTPAYQPDLLRAVLPFACNSDLKFSFAANTLLLLRNAGVVIHELATNPCMYELLSIGIVHINIHTFNIVIRELATGYKQAERQTLSKIINKNLKTLRVQVPFRSNSNLTAIATNITDTLSLSQSVQELHITREIVYFLEERCITTLLQHCNSLKRLYLTAPEHFAQDPYPERYCVKLSAWRFMIALPKFLQWLPSVCPLLEVVLLEEIGEMGDVENPVVMKQLVELSSKAVDEFESKLPVDAGSVRAQLLVWRNQFL